MFLKDIEQQEEGDHTWALVMVWWVGEEWDLSQGLGGSSRRADRDRRGD